MSQSARCSSQPSHYQPQLLDLREIRTACKPQLSKSTTKALSRAASNSKPARPAKVTFVRKTDETCAKEVVIKDYKIERKLPLNEPVTVEFTPRKGEFAFACGMNMVKGKLIVE